MPQGQWSGPISSRQGVHFVLIMERHEPRDRELNEVEHYLSQDWLADIRFVDFEPELARLRRRYVVRIEGERP